MCLLNFNEADCFVPDFLLENMTIASLYLPCE